MSKIISILAIDDDKFIQKMISRSLNSEAIIVTAAFSGEEGIEVAKRNPPDIILLDVEMAGINGYETCERLRKCDITKPIPVVFLSSHSSLRERMQGYEVGGDDQFSLDCCLMMRSKEGTTWHWTKDVISPIEKELLEMCDKEMRFLDFGQRTIVNFPSASLFVRKMPLDDMERYGRTKDILPIFLSAVNVKIGALETQAALNRQSQDMLNSSKNIRRYLFHMGNSIVTSRASSKTNSERRLQKLHSDLIHMGLEEDQEEHLLELVDSMAGSLIDTLDSGQEIRSVLSFISTNLRELIVNQEMLLEEFNQNTVKYTENNDSSFDDSVELF